MSRFLSSPFVITVPFFLIFGFDKGTQKQKGQKGITQKPRCVLTGEPGGLLIPVPHSTVTGNNNRTKMNGPQLSGNLGNYIS